MVAFHSDLKLTVYYKNNQNSEITNSYASFNNKNSLTLVTLIKSTKMKSFIGIIIVAALFQLTNAQNSDLPVPSEIVREQIIKHKGFTVSYSSAYVLSTWVAYKVSNANVNKEAKPKAKYMADPNVTTRSADKKDYKDSGYIMGQFCSYLDVTHIDGAAEETFYMTNVAPMKSAFHKHIWTKSEDLIRLWVAEKGELIVYTGAITKEAPFPTIGKNKLAIPKNYYKVVYSPKDNKAVAFRFKNGIASGTLKSHSLSVEKLEELCGFDFFPTVDEELKKEMKKAVDYDYWNFVLEEEL